MIFLGLIMAGIGFVLLLTGKIPWIGRLPGDFYFKGKNVTFYFPLATSLLISLILTLILWLINQK
ncbi:DUF2905 domain-containing protein [Syntrophus aciditrophicus]|uniref:Hypothetical membrane protein n=1 Tax=Syntrophus aciditrophicus (strain SB) TaxID=56780 RepID=Q2LRL6_SYNAS|nr:DUF2905 domain-containing protein [Syntrophus aciditrophicus]ABC76723.1 hypothetical membrane protein [Syntrophus aciditrophicus SB]